MVVQNWTEVIASSLQGLWVGVVGFLPSLLGALIVFVVGLVVAAGLSALIEKLFTAVKLDVFLSRLGLEPYFERAGLRLRGARFLGQLVNWFLIVAFLLAASDILGLAALKTDAITTLRKKFPRITAASMIKTATTTFGI